MVRNVFRDRNGWGKARISSQEKSYPKNTTRSRTHTPQKKPHSYHTRKNPSLTIPGIIHFSPLFPASSIFPAIPYSPSVSSSSSFPMPFIGNLFEFSRIINSRVASTSHPAEAAGKAYHVINIGRTRQPVFHDPTDYETFLQVLP